MILEKVMIYHENRQHDVIEKTKIIIWHEGDTCYAKDCFADNIKKFPINKLYDFLRDKTSLSDLTDEKIIEWVREINNRLGFENKED